MRKGVFVVLGFVAISIVLTWIWNEWVREAYAHFLLAVAPPVYDALGFEGARVVARRLRYINFVPFLALALVTPGIRIRRRMIGIALGLLALFVGHLVLNLTALLQPGPALPVISILISDTFPFFVWIVVAYPVLVRYLPAGRSMADHATNADADPD
jgi:hypothetical protein